MRRENMRSEANLLAEFPITVCTRESFPFLAQILQMLYQRVDTFIRSAAFIRAVEGAVIAERYRRYIYRNAIIVRIERLGVFTGYEIWIRRMNQWFCIFGITYHMKNIQINFTSVEKR